MSVSVKNHKSPTIQEALRHGASVLAHACDAPDIDSRFLLARALGQPETTSMYAHSEELLTPAQWKLFGTYLIQRAAGKPLAYLLGSWEFYGREFFITEDVLVPRPSTEDLVDTALDAIEQMYKKSDRKITVADVGCGSGCIAVTLALESPLIETIYATDISPAALKIAAKNIERYKLQDRIQLLEGNMLDPLAGLPIDLIVSNPPYIPTKELNEASRPAPPTAAKASAGKRGVRFKSETVGLGFEPRIALDGGPDGMKYTSVIQAAPLPHVMETQQGHIETVLKKNAPGFSPEARETISNRQLAADHQ